MKYSLKKLFSRVYEQRNKFRYVIEKGVQGKNNVTFDLSLCLITKFNGCDILKAQIKGEKKQAVPIDIVYIPVKGSDETLNCYLPTIYICSIDCFVREKT